MANAESLRPIAEERAPFSAWLGVVLLFALFGVIVLAIVGPSPRGNDYEQSRVKKRMDLLKTLRDEDTKALGSYAWIDKKKGTARIPISRAIELTVADLKQKKPASAGPIATPAPAAAPQASASPAPSASPSPTGTPKPTSVAGPSSAAHNQPAAAANPPVSPTPTPR
jgi:hypothetical protein